MNPYQSPEPFEQSDALYTVTPFRNLLRKNAEVLSGQIDERAKQGWRMVTSISVGGSAHYIVWRRWPLNVSETYATPQFQILTHLSFLECLRRRSFSPWTSEVAEKLASLPVGWLVESYCSLVGYVLCHRPMSTATVPNREEYSVLRRSPEWRRTLFGFSWMPVLSKELSTSCAPVSEIVTYLGDDLFLIRKRQNLEQIGASDSRGDPPTYKLAMWPNWKRLGLPGTPSIALWFQQEANQGWELLSHHAGAIFLFGNTDLET